MVLSRFWLVIFISSLIFVLLGLAFNKEYSIDRMVNGTKESPILIRECYLKQLPVSLRDSLAKSGTVVVNANVKDLDTTYELTNNQVRMYSGLQKTDGLLPTAKNTITDIILPLLAYLALFAGLMQLLIDSGAAEGMARWLSPFFVKVFPSVPKITRAIFSV
jgi:hypothetical protein